LAKEDVVDCSTCGVIFSEDAPCCPHCGTVMVRVRDESRVGLSDPAWLEKRQEERVIGRTASARPPLAPGGSEIGEDGSIHVVVSGPVRTGERGIREVAEILIGRLNHDGAHWREPRCPDRSAREERGIDCEAEDEDGNKLQMQITRADSDKVFYRHQAKAGQADKVYANLVVLVNTWRESIARKAAGLAGRKNITLALDAAEASPLPDAILLFQQCHGTWATEQGFKDIWIVGSSPEWTYRLDVAA